MLIQTLRTLLRNKTIAKERNKSEDYIRQIIAGHHGTSTLDAIEYDVAGDVLVALKERHDNYIMEMDSFYRKTGAVDAGLREKCEKEWKIFLEENLS